MKRLKEYKEEVKDPPIWVLPYYQAYYDLLGNSGFGATMPSWDTVGNYCRDLGAPEIAEDMFDIIRAIHTRVIQWQSTQKK